MRGKWRSDPHISVTQNINVRTHYSSLISATREPLPVVERRVLDSILNPRPRLSDEQLAPLVILIFRIRPWGGLLQRPASDAAVDEPVRRHWWNRRMEGGARGEQTGRRSLVVLVSSRG